MDEVIYLPKCNTIIASTPTEDQSCIVCGDSSKDCSGINCRGPERHFHCNMCTTQWCSELNKQRAEAPDLLRARNGLFKCTSESCPSPPFTPAAVCSVLKDSQVMESFISNLLYVHTLSLQEKFQADLTEQIAKLQADGSKIREEEARKVELATLAKTLRMTLRQPRMCPRCNYGPVENIHCEDLMMHHGQEDLEGNTTAINNSCPKCSYFTEDWNDWVIWDGRLPDEIRGGLEIAPAPRRESRVPCRFFSRGYCRRGEECQFMHRGARASVPAPGPVIAPPAPPALTAAELQAPNRAIAPPAPPTPTAVLPTARPEVAVAVGVPTGPVYRSAHRHRPAPIDQTTALGHPPRFPIAQTTPQTHRIAHLHPNSLQNNTRLRALDVPLSSRRPSVGHRLLCRFVLTPSGCINPTCRFDHDMPPSL
jgi:hypothetical protein